MKRILSSFLAIIIALSVIFSVPTIFTSVFAESFVIKNTYDETNIVKEKLTGKDITFLGTRESAGGTGKILQFNKIAGQNSISASNNNITRVEIYDPNSSKFESFIPESNATYLITFDYKQKSTRSDIQFNIREVIGSNVGEKLGNAAVIEANDPEFETAIWASAEAVVTVTNPNTKLAITIEYTGNSDGALWPYLDNVVVKKIEEADTTITIHHNADGSSEQITVSNMLSINDIVLTKRVDGKRFEGLYTDDTYTTLATGVTYGKTELWAKWVDVPSRIENTYDDTNIVKEKLTGKDITFLGTRESAGGTGKILQFNKIAGQNSINASIDNITHVQIYDPASSKFESFIPELDATYLITFDYKQKSTKSDIQFNIREVKDGKLGEKLGTAAVIKANDPKFETAVWASAQALVTVTNPNTTLAITIEYMGNSDGALWPYLDNVVVEKFKDGDTTLTINHSADSSTEQITVSNGTFVDEIITTKRVAGKRIEGFYTDNTYTTRANGIVFGKTELWAKWIDVPSKIENNYEDEGLEKGKLSGNNIFHFGTKPAAEPNTTNVVQFYPIVGQVEIANGNLTYIEIYDNDLNSFITEPDADYKINFDFKVKAGTYGDISFNIREVVNGKIGNVIGTAATVLKGDTAFSDYTWGKAETVVAITRPNTALAISIETSINNNGELYPYVDNIVLEKVNDRKTTTLTVNNYKNDGTSKKVTISKNALFTQIEIDAISGMNFMGIYTDKDCKIKANGKIGDCTAVWVKWRGENVFDNTYEEAGITKEILKGRDITFLGTRESSGHDGKVLQFNKIAGQSSITASTDNITRVEIYNPDSTDFESFIPEVGASYLITFDFKQKSTKSDIRFNIREVIDGKVGDILGNAGVIKGNDPKFATAIWDKAETIVTVTKPNTVLAITIEYTGTSDGALWPYLDNVSIDKIPSPTKEKELIIHNYNGSKDKTLKLPNATLFSSIEIPEVQGKKYEGLYFDKECTVPVEGAIYQYSEIWAKWRTSADADKIVNNYDDKNVYYKDDLEDRFNSSFELTETEAEKANNYITRYSDSGLNNAIDSNFVYQNFAIGSIVEGRKGNAIQLNSASVASTTNPALVKIYDNRDASKKIYKPKPNTVYKIEFYVRSTQLVSKDLSIAVKGYSDQANQFGAGTFLKYCYTINNGTAVKEWTKVTSYFTVPDAQFDFLGISLMASGSAVVNGKNTETDTYNVQVNIDDISITEVFDVYYLTVESNNGDKAFKIPFRSGQELDSIPQVQRNGYVFAGWYLDSKCTKAFTYGKMPSKNVTIYGKWEEIANTAYNLSTGFEKDDFTVSYPYTNIDSKKVYSNNMTTAVTVVTDPDDVHDEGEKYLHFEISPTSSKQTMDIAAIALLNPDGSAFQVVKGTRYTIDYSLRCETDCYVVPVVTNQTPTGKLNFTNVTEINRTWFRPYWYHNTEEWGTMKNVFVPNVTGRVYLLVYYGSSYVDIDNLEIKRAESNEVVQVKFYNEEGTGVKKTITGRPGDWMFPPVPAVKEGYVFDGWFDSMDENGNAYAKSVLPNVDMKLYPRYRLETPESENPSTVKEEGIKIDFEGDNAKQLAFYQSNNDNWIDNNDVLLAVDDPDNAYSGNNYFRFQNAGQWESDKYRRFRFYKDDTSDNRIYLDPLSVYKIGFWAKVERTYTSNLRIASFDTTNDMGILATQQVATLTEVETEDKYGEWIYYEGELTTGSEISTAGIVLTGGFLTAAIDDITVRKMKKLVVSFDSLGGTTVGSLETFENQCVVAPIEPEREGYYFGGWYTEKECKNLFDFNSTLITENITLYAKWVKIEFKDIVTYETEEIINPLPIENPELDDQLKTSIAENDPVEDIPQTEDSSKATDSKESNNTLFIVLLICGIAIFLIAGGVITFIIIKKHKKKR